jgi:hypothetical protein
MEDDVFQEGPRDLDMADSPVSWWESSTCSAGLDDRSLPPVHVRQAADKCVSDVHHVNQRMAWFAHTNLIHNVDFVIAAAADPLALRAHARHRIWRKLRLLSCGYNTLMYDTGGEDAECNQHSKISLHARCKRRDSPLGYRCR